MASDRRENLELAWVVEKDQISNGKPGNCCSALRSLQTGRNTNSVRVHAVPILSNDDNKVIENTEPASMHVQVN